MPTMTEPKPEPIGDLDEAEAIMDPDESEVADSDSKAVPTYSWEGVEDVSDEVHCHKQSFYALLLPQFHSQPPTAKLIHRAKYDRILSSLLRLQEGESMPSLRASGSPQIHKWNKQYFLLPGKDTLRPWLLMARPEHSLTAAALRVTYLEHLFADLLAAHVPDHVRGRTFYLRICDRFSNVPRTTCKLFTDTCPHCRGHPKRHRSLNTHSLTALPRPMLLTTPTAHVDATGQGNSTTSFEVSVSKDTFKFNASHFVAFPGFRERLHGHSYRASVKLLAGHEIGRDGYVVDFGCLKSVVNKICKEMNEYFLVPMLSDVLKIHVNEEGGDDTSVTLICEDGSKFIFPRQDCLLLPIRHSTAEELAIYLYGRIVKELDPTYLRLRGVRQMEVTVSESVGQDAVFRKQIPQLKEDTIFDVAKYITEQPIPPMPCATETEAAKKRKYGSI